MPRAPARCTAALLDEQKQWADVCHRKARCPRCTGVAMDAADLLSLGQRCSRPDCRQTDFLPFTCDKCRSTFCLDHRTYGLHSCPKAGHGESTTIACPLCAKAIAIPWQADPNAVFEQHTASDCDPSHWAKVHAKRRCPVPGCKEKLVASNTYECRDCGTTVCLKHRFSTDHTCKERREANKPSRESLAGTMSRVLGLGSRQKPAAPQARPHPSKTAAFKPSQPAQLQPSTSGRPQQLPQAQKQSASASETCPLCSQRFETVQQLIAHAESAHPAASSYNSSTGQERCPRCSQTFASAVALVDHVERSHQQHTSCVLC